jgi:hypothetical protein
MTIIRQLTDWIPESEWHRYRATEGRRIGRPSDVPESNLLNRKQRRARARRLAKAK